MSVHNSRLLWRQVSRPGVVYCCRVSNTYEFYWVLRNTSCSRGWLRLVVQTVFAVITIVSFVLIVIMAMQNDTPTPPSGGPSRCQTTNCRIRCMDTPYYNLYKDVISNAISFAEMSCKRISLELINPRFENATLPTNWLSGLRGYMTAFAIKRGNLNHIPPTAFMSQLMGNIRILILHHLTLKTWTTDSFIGLSNLEELHIDDCYLYNLQNRTLRAVADSLQILTITRSDYWNPAYIIGSTNLTKLMKVDFSSNYFGDVIGADSFTGLTKCRILYLNSCKITAIGPGAFDNLHNIEVIHLSSNYLVTIPPGLFNNIMLIEDPKPRINLVDNLWHCDCSDTDLRRLITEGILLVDAVCVSPIEMLGVTFTDFDNYCTNRTNEIMEYNLEKEGIRSTDNYGEDYIYVNGSCHNDKSAIEYKSLRVMYPVHTGKCSTKGLSDLNYTLLSASIFNKNIKNKSTWFTISFYLRAEYYSVVQIDSSEYYGYGLLWYQSECPDVIYCINVLPKFLRMHDVDRNAVYTFCPVKLETGYVEVESCFGYDITTLQHTYVKFNFLLYILIALFCLMLGAICVYGLIRTNPYLLKGSKRILFVKHRSVEALVLPPKIPLRNDLMNNVIVSQSDKRISIISCGLKPLPTAKFETQKSIRSNKSNAPSYVSALQPTDDQLAEWRIRHHFNDLTVSSTSSVPSMVSSLYSGDSSFSYYSLETVSDKTCDTLCCK
ncbi:hypothetical protein K1T71_004079 [Dendrolimus kikuchii]|uniref:Uncharacterized protein n=1 Tax=Dendrolimus kikuchii TaxID=765133 RepID=A0ACC1D9Y8_9NEOP|nr:hypothetical protein K1T71_004079 [Dendrolimus kikuchii]